MIKDRKQICVTFISIYYRFAKDCNFNEEQTSAFLSIVKRTHEKAVGKNGFLFLSLIMFKYILFHG